MNKSRWRVSTGSLDGLVAKSRRKITDQILDSSLLAAWVSILQAFFVFYVAFIHKGSVAGSAWLVSLATAITVASAFAIGYQTTKIRRLAKELSLNPIEFFGLVASLIEIAGAARALTPTQLVSAYREEVETGRAVAVPDEELATAAIAVLEALDTAPDFIERIRARCLDKYQKSIQDADIGETDLANVREDTRRCVCRNIHMAKKDNGGRLPDGPFRDWWERFECDMLA